MRTIDPLLSYKSIETGRSRTSSTAMSRRWRPAAMWQRICDGRGPTGGCVSRRSASENACAAPRNSRV